MASPVAVPPELDAAFSSGLAKIGLAKAQRWQQSRFLLEFMQTWKSLEPDRREQLLADAWEFRELVQSSRSTRRRCRSRVCSIFLEPFESIDSNHKRDVVRTFGDPGVDLSENVDRNIQVIRTDRLRCSEPIDGALPTGCRLDLARGPWGVDGGSGRAAHTTPGFDDNERDYKLEVAAHVRAARDALLKGDSNGRPGFATRTRRSRTTLTSWRDHEPFYRWCEESTEEAGDALRDLWTADDPLVGLGRLLDALPEGLIEADGGRVAVTAFLLLGVDAESFPPFRPDPVRQAYRLLERAPTTSWAPSGTRTSSRSSTSPGATCRAGDSRPSRCAEPRLVDHQQRAARVVGRARSASATCLSRRARPVSGLEEDDDVRAWLVRGANNFGENMLPTWFAGDSSRSAGRTRLPSIRAPTFRRSAAISRTANPDAAEGEIIRGSGILRFPRRLDGGLDPHARRRRPVRGPRHRRGVLERRDSACRTAAVRRMAERGLARQQSSGSMTAPSLYDRLKTLLTVSDLTDDLDAVRSLVEVTEVAPVPVLNSAIPVPGPELAQRLYLGRAWLGDVVDMLNEKGQVIFYGPPGTGKTFVAQALGEHVERSGGASRLVQFHPAYSYEDFFEGYRPEQNDGGGPLSFRLRHGPLREISEVARAAPDRPHLLVIDEINRGNIAKIFGELYFLLEYRERAIRLQYSPGEELSLPRNLFFIGTMNTADRSIALVDSALRRRFYFVPFLPQESPVRDVLSAWLAGHRLDEEPARLLGELNRLL